MSSPLDKGAKTLGRIQYHLKIKPGDIGEYVLLPGDPDRVLRIAKYLDDAREISHHREYRTWTGTYKGVQVSATSTGIGCPSAAIAVEELANVGAKSVIRVGSTAALSSDISTGDIIINTASMRNEGTTKFYVPEGFPAVADIFLTTALIDTARKMAAENDFRFHVGLNATDDAFYGETPEVVQQLADMKLLNVEMESAAIFAISHLRGLSAGMICGVSGNLLTSDVEYEQENPRLVEAWEHAIQIALEAIIQYEHRSIERPIQ